MANSKVRIAEYKTISNQVGGRKQATPDMKMKPKPKAHKRSVKSAKTARPS